jgi:transposase-like protein
MARPTTGVALLEKYEGEEQSVRRVQAVIETLSGKKRVVDACRELGICEALFRRFRDTCLQAAVSSRDPRKPGRKVRPEQPGGERIARLERELAQLRIELTGALAREELHAAGLAARPPATVKKTKSQKRRRRK